MADGFAHAPDLTIATLMDRDLERSLAQPAHASGRGETVFEPYSLAQLAQCAIGDRATSERRAIGLWHLEAWVRQAMGQLAVVREQNQPGAVGIESADGVEPPRLWYERDDRWAVVGVVCGAEDSERLVDRVDDALLRAGERTTIDGHGAVLVDVERRIANRLTAHADASFDDERLSGTARSNASMGQVLAQAHRFSPDGLEMALRIDVDMEHGLVERGLQP